MSQAIRSGHGAASSGAYGSHMSAEALISANEALREAWRQFDSPGARLLPPAEYSALQRRVLHLSRLVEGMLLGPQRPGERRGGEAAAHRREGTTSDLEPAAPARN